MNEHDMKPVYWEYQKRTGVIYGALAYYSTTWDEEGKQISRPVQCFWVPYLLIDGGSIDDPALHLFDNR